MKTFQLQLIFGNNCNRYLIRLLFYWVNIASLNRT